MFCLLKYTSRLHAKNIKADFDLASENSNRNARPYPFLPRVSRTRAFLGFVLCLSIVIGMGINSFLVKEVENWKRMPSLRNAAATPSVYDRQRSLTDDSNRLIIAVDFGTTYSGYDHALLIFFLVLTYLSGVRMVLFPLEVATPRILGPEFHCVAKLLGCVKSAQDALLLSRDATLPL